MPHDRENSFSPVPRDGANVGSDRPELIAYRTRSTASLGLVPAWQGRDWIEQTNQRFARRCLPLLIANQSGWFLINHELLRVIWDGGAGLDALRVERERGDASSTAVSHFGHGILTWRIPFLFRTPPGWNVLARGPANWPKDGIVPLEGVIETDWAVATFTMNWQMTAIDRPVVFEPGEPVCQIVPQRRGDLESFQPVIRDLGEDPALLASYQDWLDQRTAFIADLKVPGSDAVARGWQKDYVQGRSPDGTRAPDHQTRLDLLPFDEPGGICPPEPDN